MSKRILAGNDELGRAVLFEAVGNSVKLLSDTGSLEPGLELDGVLGDEPLAPPLLEAVNWASLPRPDANGGVVGILDVRAPVDGELGPVWRPQVEVRLMREEGAWVIEVDQDLLGGVLERGRIEWDQGSGDSHGETIAAFLCQPLEVARLAAVTTLVK